ncbi:tRNA threonylcarbamoyladenosine dehydratase 2 isoform X3 [Durio zibethinus]|uniref:tRNA threonylcarbamoyladenosine dehydratase 2 isoform X3 n=1 Tax=Durio zibethinus TaxID=66656 RepID=A0A6P6A3Q6_DURZI|nr:tRNA threonylcarbamoyladenosine dehydratase 2 isoform X3 [Durio zibethinus]
MEKLKCLALVGGGALVGAVSTLFLLKLRPRKIESQCGKKATKLNEATAKCWIDSGNGNCGTGGLNLLSDEIVSEQLTRNIQFFGLDSQQKVTASYIVIIGLGGVGSHAASMLLRSGVGKLLLVDFDQVSLSSLNRHAVATRADVGIPKAECLKKHFSSIFPECQIDAKVALLAACVRRGLKVLSATGAGARADPTRIRVADLRESTNDPLSRAVRHRLRKDYGIEGGIPVVFSLEKPKAKLLPFRGPSGEEDNPSDYQIVPGFRVRIIPVLGTIPAIFGQVMASYVVTQLAGLHVQTEPVVNLDVDHYQMLLQRLMEHEESLYGTAMEVEVDVEEVRYVVKELWHGRSARELSAKDVGRGMWRSVNELMLVRLKAQYQLFEQWWKYIHSYCMGSGEGSIHFKFNSSKISRVTVDVILGLPLLLCDVIFSLKADEHERRTLDDIKEKEPEIFSHVTSVLKRAEQDFGL